MIYMELYIESRCYKWSTNLVGLLGNCKFLNRILRIHVEMIFDAKQFSLLRQILHVSYSFHSNFKIVRTSEYSGLSLMSSIFDEEKVTHLALYKRPCVALLCQ